MISIRQYEESDYKGVIALFDDAYSGMETNYASPEELQKLSECFAEGQLMATIGNEIVGLILSLPVSYNKVTAAPCMAELYNPSLFKILAQDADSLFALEILVRTDHQRKGIGKLLNNAINNILKTNNFKAFIGVSRLSGYSQHQEKLSATDYIEKVKSGHLSDPSLSYNISNNMMPQKAITNYFEADKASGGYGALVIQPNPQYSETPIEQFFAGDTNFVKLPDESLLSKEERHSILTTLKQTGFTFEHNGYPSCWGKAFENYSTMEAYLKPEASDETISNLCKPILSRIDALLKKQGLAVSVLTDSKTGTSYTAGDFRHALIEPKQTILHLDDLRIDGSAKPDFELPEELKGNYHQYSILMLLADEGAKATLRIYNKQYTSADNQFVMPNGWQFSDDVVSNTSYVEFQPKAGDAFIMNNHCYHDVIGGDVASTWWLYSTYVLHIPETNQAFLYI